MLETINKEMVEHSLSLSASESSSQSLVITESLSASQAVSSDLVASESATDKMTVDFSSTTQDLSKLTLINKRNK